MPELQEENMFIYKITNIINNKVYIGQTRQSYAKNRWHCHLAYLRGNKHHNSHLQAEFNECKESAFKFEILHTTNDLDQIDDLERKEIQCNNSFLSKYGYNKELGGPKEGGVVSEETKRKISISSKGRPKPKMSEEHRKHLSESHKGIPSHRKGKTLSEEHRKRLSEAKMGKKRGPMSEETKEKISASEKRTKALIKLKQ
jgi:group I intron endonuclease